MNSSNSNNYNNNHRYGNKRRYNNYRNGNNRSYQNNGRNTFRTQRRFQDDSQRTVTKFTGRKNFNSRRMNKPRVPRGDSDASWSHDLYENDTISSNVKNEINNWIGNSSKSYSTGAHVQVSGLPDYINESDLQELFQNCGTVKSVTVNKDNNGKCIGTAVIVYSSIHEADQAVQEFDQQEIDTCLVTVTIINKENNSTANTAAPTIGYQGNSNNLVKKGRIFNQA
ncbi:hypothetical protein WA158_002045 [Blastocystis sp. Blastoise]